MHKMNIRELNLVVGKEALGSLPEGKLLIDTINAHSFVTAQKDQDFRKALLEADALIPDGISIVKAAKFLGMKNAPLEKVAGADLFEFEMDKLNRRGGKCFFMGSSEKVLAKIRENAAARYPRIIVETYSPPYKPVFSEEDNRHIIDAVNASDPDLLWIGMTAPKQEKWLHDNWSRLDIHCHAGAIGAVFDFFAGTLQRAPEKWQKAGLEWLYRFIKEPRRMWRRNMISNPVFVWLVLKEKLGLRQ